MAMDMVYPIHVLVHALLVYRVHALLVYRVHAMV